MDGYMTSADVAARCGIKPASVRRMRHRGDLPRPDTYAGRTPLWKIKTIEEWLAQRPGHGWRKGQSKRD